jgi:prephenate dehydratase
MNNHELAMAAFAKLARISHEKNQASGCDRFLARTAQEACLAAVLDVAEQCRELVRQNNPHHVLVKADSCTDAMRDENNSGFFQALARFCSFERAEHLLDNLGETLDLSDGKSRAESELSQIQRV